MAALGLGVGFCAAPVYAHTVEWVSVGPVDVALAVSYALLIAWAVGAGVRLGRVRSPWFGALAGLVVGLNALYFAWVWWLHAITDPAVLLWDIPQLWTGIQIQAEAGRWSILGWTPTGIALYAFWFGEAAMIVGLASLGPVVAVSGRVFCERCKRWVPSCETLGSLALREDAEIATVAEQLNAGDFSAMAAIVGLAPDDDSAIWIERWKCATCDDFDVISLWTHLRDHDGKRDEAECEAVSRVDWLYLTDAGRAALDGVRERGRTPAAGATDVDAQITATDDEQP